MLGWAGLRGAVPVVLATFPVIDHVPGSLEFFNIVFFAVIVSTLVQGTTFEPLAARLGVTTSEPALPRPLTEAGTIRRLGAEVVEYGVGAEDAVVGRRVRQLGLPREALLNVIVRGGQAIPPRGSTRIEAHDRLHVLVRQEVAAEMGVLTERWQYGPFEEQERRRPRVRGASVIFSARPWSDEDGDPGRPESVLGVPVAEHLRTRHDQPGALVALDGRPLRRHGPRGGGRRAPAGADLLSPPARARERPDRAGVVAGGGRRARLGGRRVNSGLRIWDLG